MVSLAFATLKINTLLILNKLSPFFMILLQKSHPECNPMDRYIESVNIYKHPKTIPIRTACIISIGSSLPV